MKELVDPIKIRLEKIKSFAIQLYEKKLGFARLIGFLSSDEDETTAQDMVEIMATEINKLRGGSELEA